MLLCWFVKSPKWIQFYSRNLRDTKWRFGMSPFRGCQVWGFTDEMFHSLLCVLVNHHITPKRAPIYFVWIGFRCSRINWLQGRFLTISLEWLWLSFTLTYGNQLYMDAWRMLQGLEDMNGTEKLTNQGMSQKLKERVITELGATGRTNGIKLIKGDVPLE